MANAEDATQMRGPTYESVTAAEVAALLRRDHAIATRWRGRADRVPGLNIKWSLLSLEVWCDENSFELDNVSDADDWLRGVHVSFFDEWHREAGNSGLVSFPKLGLWLSAFAALGCAVATVFGAPGSVVAVGGLTVSALLGWTWSRRRLLCGPEARGIRCDRLP